MKEIYIYIYIYIYIFQKRNLRKIDKKKERKKNAIKDEIEKKY
jgi:hypothetical protein